MPQVNLHQHTDGSLLDGRSSVDQVARRAQEVGNDAAAVTDHNEVNQHPAFQKACDAVGIHPVFGIEADWVYDIPWTREKLSYPSNRSHIVLLAQNDEGLANIWKLSTLAYTDEYRYYKPLLNPQLLAEYSAGVYASDACLLTEMSRAVQLGDEDLARQHFSNLLNIYGDRFYCELHTWQFINPGPQDTVTWEKQVIAASAANQIATAVNQAKVRFATEMGVPMVVVNDSHHAWPQQWYEKELVWKYSTSNKKKGEDDQQIDAVLQKADHLMGGDEIHGWMGLHGIGKDIVDEAIANAHRIAHSCTAQIRKTLDMPRMTDSDEEDFRRLMSSVQKGFKTKVTEAGLPEDVYFARVREELDLIAQKRFAGYFLMVEDEVEAAVSGRWAPYIENGAQLAPQLVGPGRGSAGGSLVAYLTGITSIDPIHYDLLFERFLAPGRKGFPDIDVDVPQAQRPGEKEYLSARYGHDNVCSIGTITHSKPKGILKDLCRALKIPMNEAAAMSKIVEQVGAVQTEEGGEEELSWAEVLERKGGELAAWAGKYELLFGKIKEMEGIIRTVGVHASGVVVSNKPLLGAIPLRSRPKDGMTVTQFDMYDVEELGAVKLDILGLRHLDTLMQTRNLIYERHGVWLDFRRDHLPVELRGGLDKTRPEGLSEDNVITFGYEHYADPEIWPQIDAGATTGVFQINTPALTRLAQQLKPRNERDLAALISIVRPGVKDAGLDGVYLRRRAGVEEVVYDHPMMEPITAETYGVLIYQEQLLRAARELAGFTPDEASDLQKALSKKWMDKVVAFKQKFIDGCTSSRAYMSVLGESPTVSGQEIAEKIWASIEASGRYAFNKSHAIGYAVIANWEIWPKHYYPHETLVGMMATDPENINQYVREARRRGITILPPDVNESARRFTIDRDSIRYGLDSIRGVGDAAVNKILKTRPYTSFEAFIHTSGLGKTQIEALISVGATDDFRNWQSDDPTSIENIGRARTDHMTAYHDKRILDKVAEGKRAKFTPEEAVAHVAAWREKHRGEPAYEAEFLMPDFYDPAVVFALEQQLVGNYVTQDPMGRFEEHIAALAIADPSQISGFESGEEFVIGGQLTSVKMTKIKKAGRNQGREMAFLGISWREQDFEVTVFCDAWEANKTLLLEGAPVLCVVVRDARGCNLKMLQRLDMLVAAS